MHVYFMSCFKCCRTGVLVKAKPRSWHLPDLCFEICRFSQVVFIIPSNLMHHLFFYFRSFLELILLLAEWLAFTLSSNSIMAFIKNPPALTFGSQLQSLPDRWQLFNEDQCTVSLSSPSTSQCVCFKTRQKWCNAQHMVVHKFNRF